MVGISLNGKLTVGDWPLFGTLRDVPVKCFSNGQWITLHPSDCQVIDIGVDEEHAALNRERNSRRKGV